MDSDRQDELSVPLRRDSASVALLLNAIDKPGEDEGPTIARLRGQIENQARLVTAVQELSLARSLEEIQAIVRRAAREITGADGATFVLRDHGCCYYADEDAIAPLWKGRRFPMSTCISGWAMLHREAVVIEDIYADERIPHEAYRPTFVKSLVMVPIRIAAPIGAIGNYWARHRVVQREEIELLQALANTTAVAMENVQIRSELEQRVEDRTRELVQANEELESFSYSVSHDLRAPLRHIAGYGNLLGQHAAPVLDGTGLRYLREIDGSTKRMAQLIDDLLLFSRVSRRSVVERIVDLHALVAEVQATFATDTAARKIAWSLPPLPAVRGDPALLRIAFTNLLSNAVKYTRRCPSPRINLMPAPGESPDEVVITVRDNGAGFDMDSAHKLFVVFSRLHSQEEFEGTGVGLATVKRIVTRHGGRVWAESRTGEGAAFHVALKRASSAVHP